MRCEGVEMVRGGGIGGLMGGLTRDVVVPSIFFHRLEFNE
jgi:hypothetical protein